MKDFSSEPKQHAILVAAWQAFATYGFRKTSMDDIARGAGMSRPAVYLHFKGKEEIFRSLVSHYYQGASADVATALAEPGSPAEQLKRAFDAQTGETMAAMLTSPHGMELLDTGAATAADIKEEGEAKLTALYADWLTREAEAGRIRLAGTAEAVAGTITSAMTAVKHDRSDYQTVKARLDLLAKMLGDGLAA